MHLFVTILEVYGLAVAVALTVAALIILIVALVIVIIKCHRRRKIQHVTQGERETTMYTKIMHE